MHLRTLVLLLTSLCNAAERSNPNPHPITLAPRALNTSIPTVTLAPVTNFNQALPDGLSVNLTGAQIELLTDAPGLNNDVLFILGKDAVNNLESAYQENCPNGLNSSNCEASLQAAIGVDQPILQKRVLWLVPVVVAAIAIEWAQIRQHENAISRIRMPSPNLSKLSSVQGSSTVVFATQTHGGNLITVFPSSTVGQVTIATVTADTNLAQKGDLIFGIPDQPGFALRNFIQQYGKCGLTRKRSCDQAAIAGSVAGQAIRQVGPGGVLNDLITIPTDFSFGDLIQPLMDQLRQVLLLGKHAAVLALDSTLLNAVATFLLLAAYAELTTTAPNPTQLVIPVSDLLANQQPQKTGSNDCPGQISNCSNCNGNKSPSSDPADTDGICVGFPRYDNFAAGCPCVAPNDAPLNAPYENQQVFDEQIALLTAWPLNALMPTATSTSGFTTASASSTPDTCDNHQLYNTLEGCQEGCLHGTCKYVLERMVRRCEGFNNGDRPEYQCNYP